MILPVLKEMTSSSEDSRARWISTYGKTAATPVCRVQEIFLR
jgi:hypothetical protein